MSYARAKGLFTKPPPGSQVDWTHPLSRGLEALWLFNEGAGSRLEDTTGHGHVGTLDANFTFPDAWVGGPEGGALDIVGSTDILTVGTLDDPIFSYAGIAAARLAGGGNKFICAEGGNITGRNLGMDSANDRWQVFNVLDSGTGSIVEGQWDRLVCTYDGTTGRLYVNGEEVDSGTFTPGTVTGPMRLGLFGTDSFNFNGEISYVGAWSRALTPEDVQWWTAEPYANILTVPIRRYFDLGVAVAVTPVDRFFDHVAPYRPIDIVAY